MNPLLMQLALQQQNNEGGSEMQNPSYLDFMKNNSACNQQQPSEEESGPINRGVLSALKSAKHSLGMDEEEKRRAMGLSIMKFFSNLSKPGHGPGLAGALGAVNASFNPAMDAYLNERNRTENVNASIMKQLMDAETEQRKQALQERHFTEQMQHQKQQLAETQRYHNIIGGRYAKEEKSLQDAEALQKDIPDAVPYSAMNANERANATKKLKVRADAPKANKHVLGIMDNMVKIANEYPDLSTSLSAMLGGESVPARLFMSKKERIALERMKSLANQLVLAKAEAGVGTARMGQFLEQIIAKSKANETMTPETIQYFRDQSKHIYDESLKDSTIAKKALAGKPGIGRYDVPEYYEPYKEPINMKRVEEARVKHPELQDYSDEEIWEAINE